MPPPFGIQRAKRALPTACGSFNPRTLEFISYGKVLNLEHHGIDVWYACTAKCLSPERRSAYLHLLSEDEHRSLRRFVSEELRDEYLMTRALCRTTLSLYADYPPESWKFSRNDYGKPFVVSPTSDTTLEFNLSNSRSLVAIAVTRAGREIGVDVEVTSRTNDIMGIAGSYFSTRERADLAALPQSEQRQRFFDLWTLKESYIKAKGMGLSLPLEDFSMQFAGGDLGISFLPGGGCNDPAWQFMLAHIDREHTLALCAARRDHLDATIRLREIVPEVTARQNRAK